AWSPRKGILTLRNPSDRSQPIPIDVASAFELPEGAPVLYHARDPWQKQAPPFELRAGKYRSIKLRPFEVLTLEVFPET
ncbi:MAG: enterotoxin, partial [Candidatus Baltobacteraceae bacterium]